MTTLKGAIRSYGATVRRIERDQQRRARESAKRFKEQQKSQSILDAKSAVDDWNEYLNILLSVHKNCTQPVNWNDLKLTAKPVKPVQSDSNEAKAKFKLIDYKASLIDKIFGLTSKKIEKLELQLENSKKADQEKYLLAVDKYKNELSDWSELQSIVLGIENRNPEFYIDALKYFDPFSDVRELGTQLEFSNSDFLDINLHINDLDVIPDYELSQTSTGKLSRKNMSKSKFYELYQDHVCSSILRVAGEVFSHLPIEFVRINAISKLLNSQTGHLENQPVVSVIVSSSTFKIINLATIDPSDSMRNFVHNMNFKKTVGFSTVEKVLLN